MWKPKTFSGKLLKAYYTTFEHPGKQRIISFIENRLFNKGIRFQGYNSVVTIPSGDWVTRNIIRDGAYEKKTVDLAMNLMKHGGIFIDIGANWGLFTIVISSLQKVKCIAIEASPFIFNMLYSNCINNKLKVELAHVALSDGNSIARFHCPKINNIGTSRILRSTDGFEYYDIVTCTLLDIIKHKKIDKIDLIKIDIEGHEYVVLSRFFSESNIFPANVIMEYEPSNLASGITLDDYIRLFSKHDYVALNVEGKEITNTDNLIENNIWFKRIGH